MTGPTLRYFDCRSRGEALRFALADSGIEFRDERPSVETFLKLRAEPKSFAKVAPFSTLPVLEWNGYVIAETLAIASYLGERLGHAPYVGDLETRGLHNMIVSAAHLGMQTPYSQFFRQPLDQPDSAFRDAAQSFLDSQAKKASQLERLCSDLEVETYFGGAAPAMSDFFVYESLDRAETCFGENFTRVLGQLPRLQALKTALDERTSISAYRAAGKISERVTLSQIEPELQARLSELEPELSTQ
ncbi:MAG: glutathione S-transferase family protein [Maricaulaceae bacterium]|jgi:glutathione S-transferase